MKESTRLIVIGLVAGFAGGAAFALLFFLVGLALLWAVVSGVGVFLASAYLSLRTPKRVYLVADGYDKKAVETILTEGRKKLRELDYCYVQVDNIEVKKKISNLYDLASQIFGEIERDPKNIKNVREFITYYLDATVNIMTNYGELSKDASTPEIKEIMAKVEGSLDTIKTAFEKQLASLHVDDIWDMQAEVALLEKTVKMKELLESKSKQIEKI